jgi:hypothetical protein
MLQGIIQKALLAGTLAGLVVLGPNTRTFAGGSGKSTDRRGEPVKVKDKASQLNGENAGENSGGSGLSGAGPGAAGAEGIAGGGGPTLSLTLTTGQGPVSPGDLVQVTVSMSQLGSQQAAGFQGFIHFNPAQLQFINGSYTPQPFGMAVILPVTATPTGDIDIAAGINQFAGQQPSNADAPLAYLLFQALQPQCEVLSVQWRPHSPPSRLTTMGGGDITPLTLIGLQSAISCPTDIDGNGWVNIDDLFAVIFHWGPCPPTPICCVGDVDQNHVVDIDDLFAVIFAWGQCSP